MSRRPRVVVTRRLPSAVESALRAEFDAVIPPHDDGLDATALAEAMRDADALVPTVIDRLAAPLFAAASRCSIVANYGVGVNHIAFDAARAAGVVVTNTPDVLTDDTADLTMLLMLAALRRSGEGERELRAGRWAGWRPTHLLGRRLSGRTLGIVGYGRIGRAVARRARDGFGMRVLVWSRSRPADLGPQDGVEFVDSLEALLPRVDVLSLHCPATPATHHLIAAAQLAQLRPDAILVNAARGDVVDEEALVAALEAGQLGGAALDVYEHEPSVHPGLRAREDVVLLPHQGSGTVESRVAMGARALENLRDYFAGRPPRDRVV